MEDNSNSSEQDFLLDDYNSFYYTLDKKIIRMDDSFIISKIIEKYPDFVIDKGENLLKQTFSVIASDTKLINDITEYFNITVYDLFKIIYRNYSFIFNKCFTTKIHKLIRNKSYAKRAAKQRSKKSGK